MFKSVFAFVAVSGLAAAVVRHLGRHHEQRRAHSEKRQFHDDVKRWEDEGGNLPEQPPSRKQ